MSFLGGRLRWPIVAVLFTLMLGCGRNRTPPPAPPAVPGTSAGVGFPDKVPPRQPSRQPQRTPGKSEQPESSLLVRVLLGEGFRSAEIEGSLSGSRVRLAVESKTIRRLIQKQGRWILLDSGTGFRLEPLPGKYLRVNQVAYRGSVEVFINPLGQPVLVNEVDVEGYLRGVVPLELGPHSFPQLEALKTQAVASRTFALAHRGSQGRRGFDLYADQRSQVYSGLKAEHPTSDQAITGTRGLIATHLGKPIVALYSSTCGGKTESYDALYRRPPIPYLKGGALCPDQKSRYHRWKERIVISEILDKSTTLARLGRLKKLVRSRTSSQGRLMELVWRGSRGEQILRGNELRFTLGLKSNWVVNLRPNLADGEIVELVVQGRGWGHGVGLCQMGTVELARRGWSFRRILKHYYSGIAVTKVY